MDLDEWRGSFLWSVRCSDDSDELKVTVVLFRDPEAVFVLELAQVVRLAFDKGGDTFVDDIAVVDLPRFGRWPRRVHHLLAHHNNESAMVWLQLTGPTTIEVLARTLTTRAGDTRDGQVQQ